MRQIMVVTRRRRKAELMRKAELQEAARKRWTKHNEAKKAARDAYA